MPALKGDSVRHHRGWGGGRLKENRMEKGMTTSDKKNIFFL